MLRNKLRGCIIFPRISQQIKEKQRERDKKGVACVCVCVCVCVREREREREREELELVKWMRFPSRNWRARFARKKKKIAYPTQSPLHSNLFPLSTLCLLLSPYLTLFFSFLLFLLVSSCILLPPSLSLFFSVFFFPCHCFTIQ